MVRAGVKAALAWIQQAIYSRHLSEASISDCANAWLAKETILMAGDKFREALARFVEAQQLGYPDAEQGIRYCQQSLANDS